MNILKAREIILKTKEIKKSEVKEFTKKLGREYTKLQFSKCLKVLPIAILIGVMTNAKNIAKK